MKRSIVKTVVGALVVGVAGIAAADIVWTSGAGHFVGLSGYSGSFLAVPIGDNVSLPQASTQYAVTGLAIREAWDKPCAVFLYGRELGTNPASDLIVGEDDIGCSSATITLHDVQLGRNRYVRAIQACTNDNANHRLKGLKVWSVYIDPSTGAMTNESVTDSYSQTNCKEWHDVVTCPTGEVATGVRMNVENDAFVGVELKCAPVEVN
jgi:hypothetical protein